MLGHERCFELVTASELRDAQFSLVSQIEPYIKDVMGKAEAAVLSLEQEHAALNTKVNMALFSSATVVWFGAVTDCGRLGPAGASEKGKARRGTRTESQAGQAAAGKAATGQPA